MSTETDITADTTQKTPTESTEVIEIDGSKIIESVEEMVNKQNISRLIIYKPNGDRFLDISFVAGLTMAVLTTFLLPKLLGLGIIGALLGGFKIEVVRRNAQSVATERSQQDAASDADGSEQNNKQSQGQK